MREIRDKRRWSAQRLADEMTKAGVAWDRSIVANLENDRRPFVTVEELLGLAYVLQVAPVHLLVPLGDEFYLVTPTQVVLSGRAREWIRGKYALPSADPRLWASEQPAEEWEPPPPLTEEERKQDHAQRLARVRELESAGVADLTEIEPEGEREEPR
jgi:transcriptional regulator with XRE-family HTH domain